MARLSAAPWLLAANLAYAAAIGALSLTAAPPRVPVLSTTDWLAHGLAYGLQVVLVHQLLCRVHRPPVAVGAAGALVVVFSATVEALQLLQPSRSFEVADLGANVAGIACAVALLAAVSGGRRRCRPEGPV